ncbi:hypothetical protein C8R45DRAFT_1180227, partial [Mycena sanguinolenta]
HEAGHAHGLHVFFSVLALCLTVLVATDAEGSITYKAQSPDEAALVQAAADVRYVFRGREREILLLPTPFCTPGTLERWELLNILDFASVRKRMSVIIQKLKSRDAEGNDEEARGADNVIFERLKKGPSDELKVQTEDHLNEFAGNGLWTLTLAYNVLREEEYVTWNKRYEEATVAIEGREALVETVSDEIEHDLRL